MDLALVATSIDDFEPRRRRLRRCNFRARLRMYRGGLECATRKVEMSAGTDRSSSRRADHQNPICWYLTLGGCTVTVSGNEQAVYTFRCEGCGTHQDQVAELVQALSQANEHASECRAVSDPRFRYVADVARELGADVRAELPRIDARAAAGIALSAAVLIGAVGQAQPMPVLAFMIVAAALLTVALLLFFAVLLPAPAKTSRVSSVDGPPSRTSRT